MRPRRSTLLLPALCALLLPAATGCQVVRRVYDVVTGNTPGRYARLLLDDEDADNRRRGVDGLLARGEFAKEEPYLSNYRRLARYDEDYLVRATAIRALNRARDAESAELYIRALADPHALVRLEGCKALKNMPDDAAKVPLRRLLDRVDQDADVRIAAASALKHYPDLETARTLAATLNERDFSVAWQSRQSLRRLTGQDFGYDESAWLEYFSGPETPFG